VPFTRIAVELGKPVVKNVVALGALLEATSLFPKETLLAAIREALQEKGQHIELNERAFELGAEAVRALAA
jgi:2-oxoisovalerate ferredoxin oxidoreductase beta subunit